MNECYKFDERNFKDSIFQNIDATYIIHLENNGRLTHIESQLQKYHPTQKIYILFNKGYKKCKKKDYIDTPTKDLIDAFYTIFIHAREKKYNNILILEDDFIFDEKIKENNHIEIIDKFIKNENFFLYYLGSITWLQTYFNEYNNRIIFSTGTHSIIYSKKTRDYILNNIKQNTINDWDIFLNFNFANRFKYYTPLCYQTFPTTDNSKNWHRGSYLLYILVFIQRNIFNYLKLTNDVEPGFSVFEVESRFIFWIFIIIIFYIIIIFINQKQLYSIQ